MDRDERDATAKALAALEAQRAKVNAGIAALRSLLDLPAENGQQPLPLPKGDKTDGGGDAQLPIYGMVIDTPSSAYSGMSASKAIETYLRAVNRPQKTGQIAQALKKGGIVSESANFTNTVYSRLYVLMQKGIVERRAGGLWSLSEWRQRSA